MKREELEALRARVSCEALLEQAGYEIDLKESTRRAVKYRHGGNIIIVTHDGRGWFDPLSDEKGDVFGLAMFLAPVSFRVAAQSVASLVGFQPSRREWLSPRSPALVEAIGDRWRSRRAPSPSSGAWRYLCWARWIPVAIVRQAIREGVLREGAFGSMWAAHIDSDGAVVGWEERGPEWRGFATGGSKILFRLGPAAATRLCITEAAIDAMSLAALEGPREQTLYLSTGGGWSPATDAALAELAAHPTVNLVAATDANSQGDAFAERLRAIAVASGCDWQRLRPPAEDWNEVLQNREREKQETKVARRRPAAYAPAASREASPGQGPALDPAGHEAGHSGGVMRD
ncbi:DUF3991 domain-containing protein [Agrobacterium tumefaciens]|uniref:DUF3991 and toprim domain-containing protein n=1 Tax=Agrobacterium tumefaciens TaxID=358 RepID=UPI0015735911|nr:DUF3991 and toprim domain-containing protein [Agrobacterium tumefaciens]NSZ03152.1 DUF3991 domain-containing protein [Agrobacterium tumefaciens]NSZ39767.1 DUF3991 domain-containing protein [Agrobacterium tumefaciens]NTB26725.1 DUF3991 domain-containing protein [Agrobacterium tumefaciens]NTB29958.1 DUF3991 domain-containing protein [Agrobacterium tumefaciens]NTB34326.1 DUF3991 domain-containing protein [Agrobacterium tumefaciens]